MKNMKRIHKVVIKRMYDESPDTSWLGEYGPRAESLNDGDFCFIGIRAEADYSTGGQVSPVQTISSGGLWGIESDSSPEYIKEIETEELASLKAELKAIGFSSRAISAAFKNVEESGDAR